MRLPASAGLEARLGRGPPHSQVAQALLQSYHFLPCIQYTFLSAAQKRTWVTLAPLRIDLFVAVMESMLPYHIKPHYPVPFMECDELVWKY